MTATQRPPAPPIADHIKIGLNTVTRCLESTATQYIPVPLANHMCHLQDSVASGPKTTLAVVILSKTKSDLMYSHLPMLCATASANCTEEASIRLVILDNSAETRLAESLGLPRVGVLGVVAGDTAVKPFINYVRSHVEPVHIPWLAGTMQGKYQPLKIETIIPKPAKDEAAANEVE